MAVGAEELADVGGVVDGGVEVGVVFGGDGLEEDGARLREHERGYEALLVGVAVGAGLDGVEEVGEALAEGGPCGGAAAHERVERGGGAGCLESAGRVVRRLLDWSWWRSRMKAPMATPRWGVASGTRR